MIDTSAIVEVLRNEPETSGLEGVLITGSICLVLATRVFKARIVLVSRRGDHALAKIDLWLRKMEADTSPVDADLMDLVTLAWLTCGKGRHPAALIFANRCSYALAERADEPLPFMGKVFAQTDIEAA